MDDFDKRAKRIRLTPAELGRRAGVHPSTAQRKGGHLYSTVKRLEAALEKEERDLLGYLRELYPENEQDEAA